MIPSMLELIRQAKGFVPAESTCYGGDHIWEAHGGRSCPTGNDNCGQDVLICSRCGEQDYGDRSDSPSLIECKSVCGDSMTGWKTFDDMD